MTDNKNVVPFPSSDEEKAGRVIAEAERLSRQSVLERNFWMKRSAERLGINVEELKILVEAAVKEREKKEAEAKAEERRFGRIQLAIRTRCRGRFRQFAGDVHMASTVAGRQWKRAQSYLQPSHYLHYHENRARRMAGPLTSM